MLEMPRSIISFALFCYVLFQKFATAEIVLVERGKELAKKSTDRKLLSARRQLYSSSYWDHIIEYDMIPPNDVADATACAALAQTVGLIYVGARPESNQYTFPIGCYYELADDRVYWAANGQSICSCTRRCLVNQLPALSTRPPFYNSALINAPLE